MFEEEGGNLVRVLVPFCSFDWRGKRVERGELIYDHINTCREGEGWGLGEEGSKVFFCSLSVSYITIVYMYCM